MVLLLEFLDVSSVGSKSSNRLVLKFGMPHLKQHQLMSVFSRAAPGVQFEGDLGEILALGT